MNDALTVWGIEVYGTHGCSPHEAEFPQPFVVDVTLHLDLGEAGRTDDLTTTVDYADLTHRVHQVVGGERWQLIERVAERVAEMVLAEYRLCRSVDVVVHKPHAPIGMPFRDVTVQISRSR